MGLDVINYNTTQTEMAWGIVIMQRTVQQWWAQARLAHSQILGDAYATSATVTVTEMGETGIVIMQCTVQQWTQASPSQIRSSDACAAIHSVWVLDTSLKIKWTPFRAITDIWSNAIQWFHNSLCGAIDPTVAPYYPLKILLMQNIRQCNVMN